MKRCPNCNKRINKKERETMECTNCGVRFGNFKVSYGTKEDLETARVGRVVLKEEEYQFEFTKVEDLLKEEENKDKWVALRVNEDETEDKDYWTKNEEEEC